MRSLLLALLIPFLGLALAVEPAKAPGIVVKPLLKTSLSGDATKDVVVAFGEFPPGASTGRHTHPGDEYATVLEGTLEILVDGQPARQVGAGEAYHNARDVVHETRGVGERAAKVVSTFVIDKGAPVLVPVEP